MSVSRHALSAGAANVLTRVTGLLREVVFAAVFGATMATDAYLAAFRVPNLFRDLFAEGSMANAFVPNFARTAEQDGMAEAWALANALLGAVLAVLGVLTIAMLVFAEGWVYLVAAGFTEVSGKVELTATLVRVVAPFLACVSLASIFGGMLNVRGRFFLPALAPAAFNLAVVGGCLVPAAWLPAPPIVVVAAASTLGGVAMFAVQLPALHREGFRFRPTLRSHPALWRLLAFLGPALIGIATIQVGVLVDVQLAATFGDGPVSWLTYAFRLVQLPMTLFAGAVAVAALAVVSSEVARGHRDRARATMSDAISLTSFLVLPAAIGLYLFSEPIVAVFFERGAFTAADTAATAMLLRFYAIGTFAFCLHRVVVPSFYAWGDPWTPMVLSIATVGAKIPLALWWTRADLWGLGGIPLAHAAIASVEVGALVVLLGRLAGYERRFYGEHLRIAAAGAAMVGSALLLRPLATSTWSALAVLGFSGLVYLLAAAMLRLPHVHEVLKRLRRPRGLPPHIDEATRAALRAHAGAQLLDVTEDGEALVVRTSAGELRIRASDGVLLASAATATLVATGEPLVLAGVLDIASRPPPLRGLVLRSGDRVWTFVARGDRVEAGDLPGPRVDVA